MKKTPTEIPVWFYYGYFSLFCSMAVFGLTIFWYCESLTTMRIVSISEFIWFDWSSLVNGFLKSSPQSVRESGQHSIDVRLLIA